jgi:hypothetical protein
MQIPNKFGEGGQCLSVTPLTSGEPTLKDVANGLAADVASIKGAAPATITSPAGTAVPTITTPLGTSLPSLTFATPGATLDDLTMLRSYVGALITENAQNRAYIAALRTEVIALRAAQTTRAGVTLNVTPSADFD